jgi:hypothetical protein
MIYLTDMQNINFKYFVFFCYTKMENVWILVCIYIQISKFCQIS